MCLSHYINELYACLDLGKSAGHDWIKSYINQGFIKLASRAEMLLARLAMELHSDHPHSFYKMLNFMRKSKKYSVKYLGEEIQEEVERFQPRFSGMSNMHVYCNDTYCKRQRFGWTKVRQILQINISKTFYIRLINYGF